MPDNIANIKSAPNLKSTPLKPENYNKAPTRDLNETKRTEPTKKKDSSELTSSKYTPPTQQPQTLEPTQNQDFHSKILQGIKDKFSQLITNITARFSKNETVQPNQQIQPATDTDKTEATTEPTTEATTEHKTDGQANQRLIQLEGQRTTGGPNTWEWLRPEGTKRAEYLIDTDDTGDLSRTPATATFRATAWTDLKRNNGTETNAKVELQLFNNMTDTWDKIGTALTGTDSKTKEPIEARFSIDNLAAYQDETGKINAAIQVPEDETAHLGAPKGGLRIEFNSADAIPGIEDLEPTAPKTSMKVLDDTEELPIKQEVLVNFGDRQTNAVLTRDPLAPNVLRGTARINISDSIERQVHIQYRTDTKEMYTVSGGLNASTTFDEPQLIPDNQLSAEINGDVFKYDTQTNAWAIQQNETRTTENVGFIPRNENATINTGDNAQDPYQFTITETDTKENEPQTFEARATSLDNEVYARLEKKPEDTSLFVGTLRMDLGNITNREVNIEYRSDTEEYRLTTGGLNAVGEWATFTYDRLTGQFENKFEKRFGATQVEGTSTIPDNTPQNIFRATNNRGTDFTFENGSLTNATGIYTDENDQETEMDRVWADNKTNQETPPGNIYGSIGEQQYRYDMETGVWNVLGGSN